MNTDSGGEAVVRFAVATFGREILDYFGVCGACGYPAQAFEMTTEFIDGEREVTVVVTCGQPCGWTEHEKDPSEHARRDR